VDKWGIMGICNRDRDCMPYKVYIDPTRCYGCGVCRPVCETGAIEISPRQENPTAVNIWLGEA
jgi:ferredoxin